MLERKEYANGQKIYEQSGNRLVYYFKSGKIKAEGPYENDLMEGEWKFYRETGQLCQIGHFTGSKKNGSWVRYNLDGNIEYSEMFVNDKKVKK